MATKSKERNTKPKSGKGFHEMMEKAKKKIREKAKIKDEEDDNDIEYEDDNNIEDGEDEQELEPEIKQPVKQTKQGGRKIKVVENDEYDQEVENDDNNDEDENDDIVYVPVRKSGGGKMPKQRQIGKKTVYDTPAKLSKAELKKLMNQELSASLQEEIKRMREELDSHVEKKLTDHKNKTRTIQQARGLQMALFND
jgi:hypothetical protein